jgi:hypothetical protein
MRAQLSNRDYENLSAYLDGQLAPGEQNRLEERLKTRPELKQALEEMTRTRAMLRAAPRRRAPRNFTLTPAMVGDHKRARRAGWFTGLFPTLSFASAVATLALILSLAFEFLPSQQAAMTAQPETVAMQPNFADDSARVMEAAPAAGAEPAMEPAPQELAAPQMTQDSMMAEEAPRMAGAPESEAEMKAAQGEMAGDPPVIDWGSDAGAPDRAFGMGGEYASPPAQAWGMGGGAGDSYMGEKGFGGNLVIPLEGVASLQPEVFQQSNPRELLDQPPSVITGTGPILGVPAPEEAGKIQIQSSWGLPIEIISGPAAAHVAGSAEGREAVNQPELLGMPGLRIVQGLLALLAIGLGTAAVIVRRRAGRA